MVQNHDNVIKWKHFPRFWPFVRGIHRSQVISPHKGQWRGTGCFLNPAPEQMIEKTMQTPVTWDGLYIFIKSFRLLWVPFDIFDDIFQNGRRYIIKSRTSREVGNWTAPWFLCYWTVPFHDVIMICIMSLSNARLVRRESSTPVNVRRDHGLWR